MFLKVHFGWLVQKYLFWKVFRYFSPSRRLSKNILVSLNLFHVNFQGKIMYLYFFSVDFLSHSVFDSLSPASQFLLAQPHQKLWHVAPILKSKYCFSHMWYEFKYSCASAFVSVWGDWILKNICIANIVQSMGHICYYSWILLTDEDIMNFMFEVEVELGVAELCPPLNGWKTWGHGRRWVSMSQVCKMALWINIQF